MAGNQTCSDRKRPRNYTSEEVEVLSLGVEECKDILFAKQTNTTTNKRKARQWEMIAEKVNTVNGKGDRDGKQIRKKWSDIQSQVKAKLSKASASKRKTGGGPREDDSLTPLEEKVVYVTGKDAVFGIPVGTDTADQVSLLEPNSTSVEQTKTMRPTGIVPASLSRPKYSNKVPTKDRQTNYSEVLVLEVLLFQQSATSSGWTPGTSPHYLPNSLLWLQEAACAQQRPHPGTQHWLAD